MPRECPPVCRTARVDVIEPRKRTLNHPAPPPRPLPFLVRRIANNGRMRRARKPCRMAAASYPREPSTQTGRRRGRPRSPCRGGIASTRAKASCESFRLAPVRRTARGTPRPSQIRCRLLPRLARSVGFGPVSVPPHAARTEQLSTTAHDQSMSPSRASQFRRAEVQQIPDAFLLPVAQAPPARHARSAA
jgi:hypothetical protein